MSTPLEQANQALASLAQAVSNSKARHGQSDTQLAQLKAELAQQQARAQAAENTVVALTTEIQKHIAAINQS